MKATLVFKNDERNHSDSEDDVDEVLLNGKEVVSELEDMELTCDEVYDEIKDGNVIAIYSDAHTFKALFLVNVL